MNSDDLGEEERETSGDEDNGLIATDQNSGPQDGKVGCCSGGFFSKRSKKNSEFAENTTATTIMFASHERETPVSKAKISAPPPSPAPAHTGIKCPLPSNSLTA
jgi:hypothetical protein